MKKILLVMAIVVTLNTYAILGPIPIYLNTKYRTENPVIESIASTVKLDKEDITKTGANTFLQLLASIPVVGLVNPQGNIASVFLRGTESHHTILLIDGVRVQDSSTPEGTPNLDVVPLEQIERIEITRGPYSSLYGSGAIGGIIQVFTKKGFDGGNIKINYGPHNSKQIQTSYAIKQDKLNLRVAFSNYSTDGISAHKNDLNNDKDGINRASKSFNANYQANQKLAINFAILQDNSKTKYDNCFETTSFTTVHNCLSKTDFKQLNTNANYQYSDKWHAKFLLSKNSQERKNFSNSNFEFGGSVNTKEYTWLNDIKFDNSLLTLGYTNLKDTNNTSNVSLSSKDIFAQYQKQLNDKNDVVIGFRAVNHQEFNNHNTYNLGWGSKINKQLKLTLSYGTAFKAPVFDQLFDTAFTTGNPDLKPETSTNTEIGINYQTKIANLSTNIYKIKIKNDIAFDYLASPNYANSGETLISKGVDLGVELKPIHQYTATISHNYNNSKLKGSSSQQLRRPKNTTDLTIGKKYNKFNSNLQIIKKSSSLDTGNIRLSGYVLVNFGTSYNYNDKTKLSFNINNAFDKNYTVVDGYNQPGRAFNLGLTYSF